MTRKVEIEVSEMRRWREVFALRSYTHSEHFAHTDRNFFPQHKISQRLSKVPFRATKATSLVSNQTDILAARLLARRFYPAVTTSSILAPRANPRLSLIARHLEQRPLLELNTPFSTERQSEKDDDIDNPPEKPSLNETDLKSPPRSAQSTVKMSSQPSHPALLIPGPVEFDDEVLQAMGHYR